ncbi:hypothetical protein BpHYR1_033750 [Brachionus plicatilis]|uniref:Uncharacterized protein n=1 Tax=Brachionus plicatilis TaxID=10195 RepID=A0A3M7T2P7_BRAPC|nr:hypothetical protein BpHYR1_033750 [Brachionus plicatilis]
MPHTNQMFEPTAATRTLLKRGRKKSQSLSENEPLRELNQTEIQLPNIPVVRTMNRQLCYLYKYYRTIVKCNLNIRHLNQTSNFKFIFQILPKIVS